MKRLRKIANIPKILYHATYNAYIDSIMSEGIIPGKHSNWECMINNNCVYLETNKDRAIDFCEVADNVTDDIYNSGISVLFIDTSKLDKSKFEKDLNMIDDEETTIAYNGIIPTSAIVRKEN